MKYLLILCCCFPLSLNAQTDSKVYKSFSDSIFQVGDKIITPKINFRLGRGGSVRNESRDSVKIVADFIKNHSYLIVEIGCHVDSRGNDEANQLLTERRVIHLRDYLIRNFKVDENRILVRGYGESQLLVIETDEAKYLINRRIEIKIIEIKEE